MDDGSMKCVCVCVCVCKFLEMLLQSEEMYYCLYIIWLLYDALWRSDVYDTFLHKYTEYQEHYRGHLEQEISSKP